MLPSCCLGMCKEAPEILLRSGQLRCPRCQANKPWVVTCLKCNRTQEAESQLWKRGPKGEAVGCKGWQGDCPDMSGRWLHRLARVLQRGHLRALHKACWFPTAHLIRIAFKAIEFLLFFYWVSSFFILIRISSEGSHWGTCFKTSRVLKHGPP